MSETKQKAPAKEPSTYRIEKVKQAAKRVEKPKRKPRAEKPKAVRSPSSKDAVKDARELREENERRVDSHVRAEVHRDVEGLEVHAVDGKVFLNTHGELVLDHDGVIEAQRVLAAAFQAVS